MLNLRAENEKLRMVLDVSRHMAVTIDLDTLLQTIVEAACEVLDCERATIFLYDAGRHQLYSKAATGVGEIRFSADLGIAGAAVRERVAINVPDAYTDHRFNPDIDRRTGFRTRNLLTFPLENLAGDLIGVLQTLNKRRHAFTSDDIELARVLSAQAGVALQRAFLLEQAAEKQRLERDMHIARSIQQALYPSQPPAVAGYEIASWFKTADETGGDCFDFIPMPDGRVCFVLADATGHGIGAAMVIAECRALVRALLSLTDDLSTIANGVNKLLADDLVDGRFVTAFIGILDPRRHRIHYVSGGQGPLVMIDPAGEVESRTASGTPFAILPNVQYDPAPPFEFKPGSTLALITDGFYEALNPNQELFGERRVVEVLHSHRDRPLKELLNRLYEDVSRHSEGAPPMDDLTGVLVRRL